MASAGSLAAIVLHVVSAVSLSTAAVRRVCSVLSALMVFYVVSLVAALMVLNVGWPTVAVVPAKKS